MSIDRTRSQESASTPISHGGWKYNPNDPQDVIDFENHGADELDGLERNGNYDFTDHPARQGTTDYGTLTDYVTGQMLRPATAAEHARSVAAATAPARTGAFEDEDGRAVFVAGGPES